MSEPEIRILNFQGTDVRVVVEGPGRYWWIANDLHRILKKNYVENLIRKLEECHRWFGPAYHMHGQVIDSGGVSTVSVSYMAVNKCKEIGNQFAAWINDVALPLLGQPITDDQREKEKPREPVQSKPRLSWAERDAAREAKQREKRQAKDDLAAEKRQAVARDAEIMKARKTDEAKAKLPFERRSIAEFVDTRCVIDKDNVTPKANIYAAYLQWCSKGNMKRPDKSNVFGRNLFAVFSGVKACQKRDGTKRIPCYSGISLKDPEPNPVLAADDDWALNL